MKSSQYSLKDLHELTGVEPRTIRWYIAEGLMRGPEARGRNAYYGEQHRARLEAIKSMKDRGLSLREIRRYCQMAGDEEIPLAGLDRLPDAERVLMDYAEEPPAIAARSIARPSPDPTSRGIGQRSIAPPDTLASDVSAVYRARARRMREEMQRTEAIASLQGRLAGSPPATLAALVREALGGQRVPRKARSEPQHIVEITPEVGLVLRGDYTVEERAVFEELADVLREWLIGGGGDSS